ncbi:CPBP family intramembrane glutamic endopeptidase [Clostridium tarantellae]|uniref:CPBP family intramembrane metalloprotease n=1 Tax=Clostridium tarantellae TaxID=39493 RepID=A0A6I1MJT0_9CLOT|nr:CPBP family intramembrane glutamic endopeptidase [Clostridium tarantellae]MPQ43786.1 CPBP family intramembrane metalloprotease [Clostridium tarantellae]
MDIHIQCLSIIVLLATFSPTILAQLGMWIGKDSYDMNKIFKLLSGVFLFLLALVFVVTPNDFNMLLPKENYWYGVAILAVPFTIFTEIALAYMVNFPNRKVKGLKINFMIKNASFKIVMFTVIIAISEEFIYRQLWFSILLNTFSFNIVTILLITSIVYALNHISLGKVIFIQKIFSGLIYGCLFYFSGYSVIIPVITHCLQNISIVSKD